ncbi:MAG: UvrD-helicase domain-containing protein [Clostridia bacterium]|nr:UvrD-helicase domain-containing protein [Clostridia bacterium]
MEWTTAQTKAIEDRGHTLLVSAGAGAGKTSCLTERIARRLVSKGKYDENGVELGYDINDILVVTFTKAAAADIKEKLYKNLAKRLSETPDDRGLFAQLMGVGTAHISTIHSFCLDLIKDNFQKLDVSPSVRVLDDTEGVQLKKKLQKKILDDRYESEDPDFLEFVESFTSLNNDAPLEEMLLEIYNKLRSFPDPFEWLERMIVDLEKETDFDELYDSKLGIRLKKIKNKYLESIFELLDEAKEIAETVSNPAYYNHFAYHEAACETLRNSESYDASRQAFSYKPSNLYTRGLDEDDAARLRFLKSEISDNKLQKLAAFYENDSEAVRDELKRTVKTMRLIQSLEIELDRSFREKKRELGVLDYSDLEHYTLELLREADGSDSEICLSLRESLREIYIDEYQDINPLQDEIFRRIRKKNNCFMVGDVKQSIYRFRNAEPSIFMGYNDSFPKLEDAEDEAKLYLSENFRSSRNIINYVNEIFRKTYTAENGASGYGDEEALRFGETEMSKYPVVTVKCESLKDEAEFCAREIVRAVKANEYTFNDVALLLRSVKTTSKEYIEAFKKYGIPFIIEQSGDFLARPEVLLAMSLLRAIDNPMDDVSLASTAMSPIFNITAEELYEIRKLGRKKELFRCFRSCAYERARAKKYTIKGKTKKSDLRKVAFRILRETNAPLELKQKCKNVLERLKYWRTMSENVSTESLLWYLYTATPLYSGVDSADGRSNLILLYEYARRFEGSSFRGLSAFVEYYNDVSADTHKLGEAAGSVGDGVRIMSVHKSKGLDFPTVFVGGLGKRMNTTDMNKKYMISRLGGLSFRFRNADERKKEDTLLRRLDAFDEKNELFVEEMRLLYVALTRAKKRLFVLGNDNFNDSMFSLLIGAVTPSDENVIIEYKADEDPVQKLDGNEEKLLELSAGELKTRLEYTYSHKGTLRKASVSELKLDENGKYEPTVNRSIIMERPSFSRSHTGGAQRGTAMHEFMQFCDFLNVEQNGALEEAKRLCAAKMLESDQLPLLNLKKLEGFFTSKVYAEIKASPRVYREKRFSISENADLIGGNENEQLLVQGVIDLFFENDDGTFTVVDYKTDYVGNDDETVLIEHHRSQLRYYARAIEKMTAKKVSRAIIYSFSLEREVVLPEI